MDEKVITLNALVIEDSRVMRQMIMNTLQKTELALFNFVEAGDGAEAIEKFDPDKIDIVFSDWNMPKMNGIEFARHVRSMSAARSIPVVMITSESADGRSETAFEKARISCYITKPFTEESVKGKLAPVIEELTKRREHETQPPAPAPKPSEPKPKMGFFSKLMG